MRLQLTKRSEYAIRASVLLAAAESCPVSSRRIAERMGVPATFLPQVLSDLQRAGFVESTSGKAGGYCLRADPERVSLLELIEAIEGPTRGERCALDNRVCSDGEACALHETWAAAQSAFIQVLAGTSLLDVTRRWLAQADDTDGLVSPLPGLFSPERIPA
ncbi:MAG TPA: Rrf2 family transcriptional regulator [Candidatus Limnocylindrales bacterium]